MNNRFIKLVGENDRTLIDVKNIAIISITDGMIIAILIVILLVSQIQPLFGSLILPTPLTH
jgi:hypothetical protein